MGNQRKKQPIWRFALPAVLLILAAAVLLALSIDQDREYRALSQVTPVPTATVRSDVRVLFSTALGEGAVTNVTDVPAEAAAVPAVTPAPTGEPAPTGTPGFALLRSGSTGERVRELQTRLKELGYYSGEVDGDFGPGTLKAVKLFQTQHGLSADGIVGEQTWAMLTSGGARAFEPTPTPCAQDLMTGERPFLINKTHPVDSDFVPADLVYIRDVIPSDVAVLQSKDAQGVREAVEALRVMLEAARADGIGHWKIREAYRTYADQERIFNNYVEKYVKEGRTRANAVSVTRLTVADPGTSEHHSGLAFDLNATDTDESFAYTAQYAWLYNHCWEYGFVIRYTDEKEDVTGFLGEEWHYRYVGREHAEIMHKNDMCLEEYLDWLDSLS